MTLSDIKNEAEKRYRKGSGYIGSQHDAFYEGAKWAIEQLLIQCMSNNVGWVCPRCGKVNAPWVSQCSCEPSEKITISDERFVQDSCDPFYIKMEDLNISI